MKDTTKMTLTDEISDLLNKGMFGAYKGMSLSAISMGNNPDDCAYVRQARKRFLEEDYPTLCILMKKLMDDDTHEWRLTNE